MIIGTAGHVDHGKTSLVRALTGIDTDRLKEEKARGMSIDLGFAYLATPDGDILGFVDVPGHERFVRNMLAGASGIDFVLLVVAADDGLMPQTFEHLAIVDLLGIERGIVVLTKPELVTPEQRATLTQDIARAISATRLAGADVVSVSAATGEGINELRERLFAASRIFRHRPTNGRFRLAVDRCFTIAGAGTIVTGTVLSGAIEIDDRVTVSPKGLSVRVRSIHSQNRPCERGKAGERCALNLVGSGVTKDAIARGDVVLDDALHAPTGRIDAKLRMLATEGKPIGQWTPVRLYHAAVEVGARVILLGDKPIPPGDEAYVQLVLERPIAAAAGDRYVLRDPSVGRTIGGGCLLDLRAPARKRRTPERLAALQALALAEPDQAIAALLDRPPFYLNLFAFARDHALALSEVEAMVDRLGGVRISAGSAAVALSPTSWLRLRRGIVAAIAAFHAANPDLRGLGIDRLRLILEPPLRGAPFAAMVQDLVRAGELMVDGSLVRLPKHEVHLTEWDEEAWQQVRPLFEGSGRFRPPRVGEIAGALSVSETKVRRLMKLLERRGYLIEVSDEHFFHRGALAELIEIAADIGAATVDGRFTASQFRDRIGIGRRVAIQILEFFDSHGVTLRRGDARRLNRQRLDLFNRTMTT